MEVVTVYSMEECESKVIEVRGPPDIIVKWKLELEVKGIQVGLKYWETDSEEVCFSRQFKR